MADIEKVIKQISAEIKLAEYVNKEYQTIDLSLLKDALELLKEQQEKIRVTQLALDIAMKKGIVVKT